jgi:hypothetical protein
VGTSSVIVEVASILQGREDVGLDVEDGVHAFGWHCFLLLICCLLLGGAFGL